MTDRELLELAAKAAGLVGARWEQCEAPWENDGFISVPQNDGPHARRLGDRIAWNPLTDDGDALRLAVKLEIMICRRMNINGQFAVAEAEGQMFCPEPWFPDPYAATRRAIVRVAAAIGEQKT